MQHNDNFLDELDDKQLSLLNLRLHREFYILWPKDKVINEINNSTNAGMLEEITQKFDLCDYSNFQDLNIFGAKEILKIIVDVLYKYPQLRGELCYIGTIKGFQQFLVDLSKGNMEIAKKIKIKHIFSYELILQICQESLGFIKSLSDDSAFALAVRLYGIFDALLISDDDFKGYNYLSSISLLRTYEKENHFPQGCNSLESVICHELGHLLDFKFNFSKNRIIKNYYARLKKDELKEHLSAYASTSIEEFIAEVFAEYQCNPSPRKISKDVMDLLEKNM